MTASWPSPSSQPVRSLRQRHLVQPHLGSWTPLLPKNWGSKCCLCCWFRVICYRGKILNTVDNHILVISGDYTRKGLWTLPLFLPLGAVDWSWPYWPSGPQNCMVMCGEMTLSCCRSDNAVPLKTEGQIPRQCCWWYSCIRVYLSASVPGTPIYIQRKGQGSDAVNRLQAPYLHPLSHSPYVAPLPLRRYYLSAWSPVALCRQQDYFWNIWPFKF